MLPESAHTRALILLLSGVLGGASLLAAPRIKLADGVLVLGSERFVVRGLVYSNAAIGELAGSRMAASPCRYARDLPLVAALGANTVRTPALLPEDDKSFVWLLESAGLYWLAGFPLEPYYDAAQTIMARQRQILDAFREYARRFRGQRRLIGYVFGAEVASEYARKFAGSSSDFYALLAEAAAVLRELEPEETPLLATAVSDPAELAQSPAGLSFWCWNASPGRTFGGRLEEVRRKAAKPVLISEFGVDAFDQRAGAEDEQGQAEAAVTLAGEIESAGWLLGGVYHGFLDEWWRGGPEASRHAAGGSPHSGFPDGFRNDGWFGIFRATATERPGLDSLRPRAVFRVLAGRWGSSAAPMADRTPRLARLENAASGAELAAPGALVRLSGEGFSAATKTAESWPLHLDQTCLCLGTAPARLGMLAPGELTAQVPPEVAPAETTAVVYRAGAASNFLPARLRRYAPGIFPRGVLWAGSNCVAGGLNGMRPGDALEIYGTGLGPAPRAEEVEAFLGGVPARVLYAGLLDGLVGVNQVNVQAPPELSPDSSAALELRAGGTASNLYPLSVAGPGERPGIALRSELTNLLLQAGGDARTLRVDVEGVSGFCGAVRFQAAQRPEGVSFEIPIAFPGQTVPLAVRAAPGTPAFQDGAFVLTGYSGGASGSLTLSLTVLPNQGDVVVRVVSGGFQAGSLARFEWNNRTVFSTTGGGPGRGVSVLSVNSLTGVFSASRTFDTWADEQASNALVTHLAGLPDGTIVLLAVADEASYRLSETARAALATWFGSQYIRTLGYQHSWALIGRKHASKPLAEGASADRQVILEQVLTLPQP